MPESEGKAPVSGGPDRPGPDVRLTTRPNNAAITAITAVSTVVALTPLAIILDIWWIVPVSLALAAAGAIFIRGELGPPTIEPRYSEFLLASVGALFAPALLSALWLGFAQIFRLALDLALPADDARTWARALTSIVGLSYVPFTAVVTARRLARQLYPDVAGARSPLYQIVIKPRRLIPYFATAGLVAVIALVVALVLNVGEAAAGLVLVYGIFVSSAVYTLDEGALNPAAADARDLASSLATEESEVARPPRSTDPAVDPYLAELDLVAFRDGVLFAMDVKKGGSDAPKAHWGDAAEVQFAASVLRDVAPSQYAGVTDVVPVLVVLDRGFDDDLEEFCRENEVALVVVDEGVVDVRTAGRHREQLDELSRRTFGRWESAAQKTSDGMDPRS